MLENEIIKIYCSSCKIWFNSPMGFVQGESFDADNHEHKIVECPFCNQKIICNEENVRHISNENNQ